MKLLIIISILATVSVAQKNNTKQDKPVEIKQNVIQNKYQHEKYTVPMSYKAWKKLSPKMQKTYAEVSVDALKWSYLFNDCDPLTGKEITKAIQNSDKNSPIMMAIAEKAYEICQN